MKNAFDKLKALFIRLSGYLMLAFASAPMMLVRAEGGGDASKKGLLGYDIGTGYVNTNGVGNLNDGFTKMRTSGVTIYHGVVALALVVVMIIFILQLVKLANSGDNAQERKKAIGGIITLLVAVALIGGAATITSWVWNALSEF